MYYKDIRDGEKSWSPSADLGKEREREKVSIRPQGDNAGYILNSLSAEGLSLAALTVSLAQAVLKEVH